MMTRRQQHTNGRNHTYLTASSASKSLARLAAALLTEHLLDLRVIPTVRVAEEMRRGGYLRGALAELPGVLRRSWMSSIPDPMC